LIKVIGFTAKKSIPVIGFTVNKLGRANCLKGAGLVTSWALWGIPGTIGLATILTIKKISEYRRAKSVKDLELATNVDILRWRHQAKHLNGFLSDDRELFSRDEADRKYLIELLSLVNISYQEFEDLWIYEHSENRKRLFLDLLKKREKDKGVYELFNEIIV
jgi:hypothetical protein